MEVFEEVEASRNLLASAEAGVNGAPSDLSPGAGFGRLAGWMRRYGPDLRRARAEFDQLHAVAGIETPLPNPEISFGPLIGSDLDSGSSNRVKPFVEFGFSIPLSGRLSRQDDINRSLADEAYLKYVVQLRRGYLELRGAFAEWVLAKRRASIREEILESSRRSTDLTRRLAKAGAASALDVGLMELETAHHEADLAQARSDRVRAEEELSRLVGVGIARIRDVSASGLPDQEQAIPALDEAKKIMVFNNPDLAVMRAGYEVAERRLELEVARQYPDLDIGFSFEGDPGESKKVWGLGLGLSLPVFDGNQQGIMMAEKEREKIRSAYEAALGEELAALEGLYERYGLALEKQRLLAGVAIPRSRRNLDVALRSIRAGAIDSLKYLEVERAMRSLLIEAAESEWEARKTLNEMERIVGRPLVPFPDESDHGYPSIADN
jgi:cobalt-zinc-cadmium efflux system outer membrane protein